MKVIFVCCNKNKKKIVKKEHKHRNSEGEGNMKNSTPKSTPKRPNEHGDAKTEKKDYWAILRKHTI